MTGQLIELHRRVFVAGIGFSRQIGKQPAQVARVDRIAQTALLKTQKGRDRKQVRTQPFN